MRKHTYRARGYFIAEYPVALWFLFFCLVFPMLNLSTIALRGTFFLCAVRETANVASKAKTFQTSLDSSQPSAKEAAYNQAMAIPNAFAQVTIDAIDTYIVAVNLNNNQMTIQKTPLTTPADTQNYLYNIQVVIKGSVSPLITLTNSPFGLIPGITGPVSWTASAQQFCECPQGLNQ